MTPLARYDSASCETRLLLPGALHTLRANCFTVGDEFSSIGSYNLDCWSDRHNMEVTLTVANTTITARLDDALVTNLLHSPR